MKNEMKDKNRSTRTAIWGISSLLVVLAGSAAITLGTALYFEYWVNDLTDILKNELNHTIDITWFTFFGAVAIFIAALILSVIKCGRLDENGEIHLTWFDKIFTDLQIIAGICAGALYYPIIIVQGAAIYSSKWITLLPGMTNKALTGFIADADMTPFSDFGSHNWAVLVFVSMALTIATFAFELLIIQSLAKKLKNHCFWRRTLIGTLCCYLSKYAKKSDNIFAKVMIILIVCALICATWIGTVAVIILIIIFVPKWLAKYQAIKDGVGEIKGGNLDYKIPVEGDGEFERLAANINDIGEAQSAAIQNELKNQRLKTDLISNVSHDLKTPLTSMVSYVDLLKKEGLDSENAPEYLRIIDEKTNRLQKLTEDLFEAAKASSGDIPVNMERIEMISIANQAMAELEENLAKNDIQVVFTPKTESAFVMADGQLLWRVIENLLTNVSKYALPGSRAYVDITEAADKIRLEVKNMSKDQLNISADELMERFKRGDESRNTEGSGLGLAIAKDLTTLMDGSFDLKIDGDLFKAIVELNKA